MLATGAYTLWDPSRATDARATQLQKTVDRGAFTFSQNCRVCHGDAGEGGAASNRLAQAPPLNRPDLQGVKSGAVDPVEKVNAYKRIYYTIFGILMFCTYLTVQIAFLDLGVFNIVAALAIAVFKAVLVVLFFMHVKYSSRLTWASPTTSFRGSAA